MRNRKTIAVSSVRQYLLKIYLREKLKIPPVFDDGKEELSDRDWQMVLYSIVGTTRAIGFLLDLDPRTARRIQTRYYQFLHCKKKGKELGARTKLAKERRELIAANLGKSPEWIAEEIGVTLESAKTMLHIARRASGKRPMAQSTKIALAEAYIKNNPGITDDGLAKLLSCTRKMAGEYRRKAGVHKRPDRRRQNPPPLRLVA